MRKSATKVITLLTFISTFFIAYIIYAEKNGFNFWKNSEKNQTELKALPHGTCNSCHINHTAPGGELTNIGGNANLCISCHNAAGSASTLPFANANKAIPGVSGNSHSWDKLAINAIYETNIPSNAEMSSRIPSGNIICSTCHNQHSQDFPPFLRATNSGDALCKECHSARDVGNFLANTTLNKGSHPVGVTYNNADTRFLISPLSPMTLVNSKVECSSCHSVHYAATNDGNLLRATNNDALCANCHTYGVHHGMSCSVCHQTHNPNKTNIFMIKDSIVTPSNGTVAVVLSSETGVNSYADGDANYNGVCEACHTTTAYHRNNGSGNHSHNTGANCIGCHPHKDAFSAGDCITCHALAQDNGDGIPVGGRRAIIGEFPASNAHAHYGAAINAQSCQVCHDMSTHKSGIVKLIDADNSSIYQFIKPENLTTDPDVSNFCMSCHDANGATRLATPLNPFGNGNIAPDVKMKFQGTLQWNEWYGDFCFGDEGTLRSVNSHHDISNADQIFSGAKIECLNCHGSHISSATTKIANPNSTNSVWAGTYNDFCLTCHSGGTGPTAPGFPTGVTGPTIALRGLESCGYTAAPWYVDYIWSNSSHGLNSKRPWASYSGAPSYNMSCKDCHDPHGSYTPTNTLGNPYMIRDYVDGSMFVDDGDRNSGWTGPPWTTFGLSRAVVVSISGTDVGWGSATGLCNVCHPNWEAAYDWHSYCGACQTCHGHGQAFGENDWGSGGNSIPCGGKSTQLKLNELSKEKNKIKLHSKSIEKN